MHHSPASDIRLASSSGVIRFSSSKPCTSLCVSGPNGDASSSTLQHVISPHLHLQDFFHIGEAYSSNKIQNGGNGGGEDIFQRSNGEPRPEGLGGWGSLGGGCKPSAHLEVWWNAVSSPSGVRA